MGRILLIYKNIQTPNPKCKTWLVNRNVVLDLIAIVVLKVENWRLLSKFWNPCHWTHWWFNFNCHRPVLQVTKCTELPRLSVPSCMNMNELTHKFTWNMCFFDRPEGWRKWNDSGSVKRWRCWSACSIQTLSVSMTPGSPPWKDRSASSLWRNSWRQGHWRRKFSPSIVV